ncbi:GIY-YIG nuclease family protein [Marinilabiliaceae bacterium JC017]|nr:GIY-YIG nuclease family protein [Marinilabiliaceae bacterium JC017]
MPYFVYILHCEKAGKYYVGQTSDPHKRLQEHNSYESMHKYTAKYKPWTLEAYFVVSDERGDAMKVERYIKNQKSALFIRDIIANYHSVSFIDELKKKVLG